MKKLISKEQAVALIESGSTLAVGGFGAYGAPETLLQALADRFDANGAPTGLTVTCGISPGDNSKDNVGLNRIAKTGLLDTVIAGHFANPPLIAEMVGKNEVAGYAVPLGVMIHLYNAIAGHKPALVTNVGLGTYADPRNEGCKANAKAVERGRDIVELVNVFGQESLAYKPFPIDFCFIRAYAADEDGNLSMEDGALGDYMFDIAAATHNSGGTVIVEVKNIVKSGSIHPKKVRIHAPMVDYVVRADEDKYKQGYAADFRPELCGDITVPVDALAPMKMSNRKIIARRGVMELTPDCIINLGIGIPSGIGSVANEEGIHTTLSLESGPQGGVPVEGMGFGASADPEVIYIISDVFHLYDGGVLDQTFLGAAEIDEAGNVNVSKFGTRCTGPGGFINISQNTPCVCFVGTFTAGGLVEEVKDGKLVIVQEGRQQKFVKSVQQITFSGDYARKTKQRVMYITERAVFELHEEGLVLTEIAPGVDLEKDVLGQMGFAPVVSPDLKLMDERIFREAPMHTGK